MIVRVLKSVSMTIKILVNKGEAMNQDELTIWTRLNECECARRRKMYKCPLCGSETQEKVTDLKRTPDAIRAHIETYATILEMRVEIENLKKIIEQLKFPKKKKNHIFVIEWMVGDNGDQYVPIDYEDTLPAAEKVMEKYKSLNAKNIYRIKKYVSE